MKNKSSTNSIGSSDSFKDRHYDTLQFRIDFVKELIGDSDLEPMIDIDNSEKFLIPYTDKKSNNARILLNKKILNFSSVITEIGGRLEYIKSGTTGHAFKGHIRIDNNEIINFGIKVVAYPKKERYGNINDIKRPENAELMMIRLLSQFITKKQSPYIILPIATFNTPIETFVKLTHDGTIPERNIHGATEHENKKFVEFVKRYENGDYYSNVSILICEWANQGDLLSFIRRHYKDKEFTLRKWKVLFFQIISVLAVIQHKYPSFRHNDLKANNILLHKIKDKSESMEHIINEFVYVVPTIGYHIKLWDFDFACIPDIVDNYKVSDEWTTKINVDPVQNRYYDMHYFFNTLIKKSFFAQFMEEGCVPKEAQDFVNRIVPPKFQKGKYMCKVDGKPKDRIAIDEEYKIPEEVLRTDPFFEEFRKGYVSKRNKTLSISNILEEPKETKSKYVIKKEVPSGKRLESRTDNRTINMRRDQAIKKIASKGPPRKKDGILYINLEN